jgi:murein DD-endopeptidase MepM/ murein hydrolase activator NlpD
LKRFRDPSPTFVLSLPRGWRDSGQPKSTPGLFRLAASLIVALALLWPAAIVGAQDQQPDGPVYIVQDGDSLWDIALRFGVSLDALEQANGITDPNQIGVGARLVIPGLEGIQGVLTTEDVPFGENLKSLSRRYQVPEDILIRLNHLTSPEELYAGASLIIPDQNAQTQATTRTELNSGLSMLELAVIDHVNPWALVTTNALSGTWSALPGDVMRLPGSGAPSGTDQDVPGALPEAITALSLVPRPLVQGKAAVLHISGPAGLTLNGTLVDHDLHFFPEGNGEYVSLQGIHALTEPGLYPLSLNGILPSGQTFFFSQSVFVKGGDYPYDPPLTVSPETLDPAVTKPEDAQWMALTAPFSPEKLWDGLFTSPAPPPFDDCWPSRFGDRRSYNGSDYIYFHSGLDFCGGVGTKILAPAAGTVIFTGPLTVRGNATVIDHGWGVYTGYMHQSEILVQPGDHVEAGQVIGLVGGTGRVTGPHLHWEVIIGDVQVDPMDWLNETYP